MVRQTNSIIVVGLGLLKVLNTEKYLFCFKDFAGTASPDLTTCVGNKAENCSTRILIKAAQSVADKV